MPTGRPDSQFASRRRQRVGENERTLLGQPQRRLVAAPSVVQRNDPSRKLAARLDRLPLGLGDVVAKEETRTERAGTIAAHEHIDVPNVIRLENNHRGRRVRVESLPYLSHFGGRSKWVQNQCLAPRLNTPRRHEWLPALTWLPGKM